MKREAGNTTQLHEAPLKHVHPLVSKHYRYAVVGASSNPKKFGNVIFFDLKNAGFFVTPVHPTLSELGGVQVAKSLREVKPTPDVAVVVVPPTIGMDVLDDAKAAGIKKLYFQPGAESNEIKEKAKHLGLEILADGSCIMVDRRRIGL